MDINFTSGTPKRSAAHIRITKKEPTNYIGGLRALLEGLPPGVNKHDRADVLIEACISDGVVMGSEIIALAAQLGFTPGHVNIRLKLGAGGNPDVYRWQRDKEGRYSLYDRS